MKLEKHPGFITGIKCDLCGADHEQDFTYYSLDFKDVKVQDGRHVAAMKTLPVSFSIDACVKCLKDLADAVGAHYAPTRDGVNCDLCGRQMRGSFSYHYCNISEATVRMSAGAVECGRCRAPAVGTPKQCKCGAQTFVKVAGVTVNDTYLQVAICQRDYETISTTAAEIRQRASQSAPQDSQPPGPQPS